jgi:hypothetical protein
MVGTAQGDRAERQPRQGVRQARSLPLVEAMKVRLETEQR